MMINLAIARILSWMALPPNLPRICPSQILVHSHFKSVPMMPTEEVRFSEQNPLRRYHPLSIYPSMSTHDSLSQLNWSPPTNRPHAHLFSLLCLVFVVFD